MKFQDFPVRRNLGSPDVREAIENLLPAPMGQNGRLIENVLHVEQAIKRGVSKRSVCIRHTAS